MTSKKNALLARPVLTMVLGLAGPLTNVAVAQQIPNQKSVVRVTGCDGSNGTGFVWGEPTLVVTALHVVAACGNVVVHTEDRVDRAATILKVSLEGDLALLRLAGPLGLPPFKEVVPGEPTISQPFKLFSYPNAVPTMTGAEIHFAQGRDRMVTTLEEAFRGVVGYKDLTAGDSYPKASAQIFRVRELLQHGESGAPIFDDHGRVAGIVDGGLHGGLGLVNWSIAAFK